MRTDVQVVLPVSPEADRGFAKPPPNTAEVLSHSSGSGGWFAPHRVWAALRALAFGMKVWSVALVGVGASWAAAC